MPCCAVWCIIKSDKLYPFIIVLTILRQVFSKVLENLRGLFWQLAVLTVVTAVVTPITNTQTGCVTGFFEICAVCFRSLLC